METPPPPLHSHSPATPHAQPPKKGLGTGAKIGIGCGAIIALVVIAMIAVGVIYGDRLRDFAEEAQKNPARATANMMVTASRGAMEMVAEDDVNKRYTIKDKESGELTTIYWDEEKKAPEIIQGDFSAIPTTPATDTPPSAEPGPAPEPPGS